jgi:hypothetical protein
MTILDNDRGYSRPVEEVARAILKARYYDGEERFYVSLDGFYSDCERVHWDEARAQAVAVLGVLRQLGFISDLGITAIEAERNAK